MGEGCMRKLIFSTFCTVVAFVHVLISVAVSSVMIACAQSTYLSFLTTAIVLLEVMKLLAPVATFDEKPIKHWTGVYTNAQTIVIVSNFLPEVVGDSDDSLVHAFAIFHLRCEQNLSCIFAEHNSFFFILYFQNI